MLYLKHCRHSNCSPSVCLSVCHSQQAELALQEAIRIAQESNDHVCLQHCLVRALCKWALTVLLRELLQSSSHSSISPESVSGCPAVGWHHSWHTGQGSWDGLLQLRVNSLSRNCYPSGDLSSELKAES